MRDDDPGVGNLGLNLHMDGQVINIAQKMKKGNNNDDPNGNLGLVMNIGGHIE